MSRFSTLIQKVFTSGQVALAPPLRLSDALKTANQQPDFPLSQAESQRMGCFNGSAALAQLADQANLGVGDTLLMPAYVCGAEFGPFAARGCKFCSYNIQPNLQVDLEDLNQQLNDHTVQAVLLTHYFGFAQRQMVEIAQLCQNHKVLLIEDCAHALFALDDSHPVGQYGDYAIFSPRKSLALTDGGLLLSNCGDLKAVAGRREAPLIPVLDRLINALLSARRTCRHKGLVRFLNATLQLALLPLSIVVKAMRLAGQRMYEHWLSPEIEGERAEPLYTLKMSRFSARMLDRVDGQEVRRIRQQNYRQWLSHVEGLSGCDALIAEVDVGSCPLYFPVLISDPATVVERLHEEGIEAYHWWSNQHPAVDLGSYPHLQKLKKQVLALPVHQGLGCSDIDRMAAALARVQSQRS